MTFDLLIYFCRSRFSQYLMCSFMRFFHLFVLVCACCPCSSAPASTNCRISLLDCVCCGPPHISASLPWFALV
ncbi:uncharacterized protein EDB91DRAFT_1174718 [Suillus paluster]|uniref:uncharacterized protein n=1 Tax=Suillus paluster TaxID=48578 RepID=UPI001B861D9E|nr:uncharacterized protein EDB91DRAFT_1174718 [Suillus paluster]KAG1722435.1 hypothetical protein EDB91DRAFT_1174718 [Suillus paluster]